MSDDPFSEFAATHMSAYGKAKLRANATREERRLAKAELERQYLFQQWQKWHREKRDALMTGAYAEQAQQLADFIETMQLEDGAKLIELVAAGPWREADPDTQFCVLELINHAIVWLRESAGLAPFNDSLPWSDEELTVFEIIRSMINDHTQRTGRVRRQEAAQPRRQQASQGAQRHDRRQRDRAMSAQGLVSQERRHQPR
jgi:hypothetical protein